MRKPFLCLLAVTLACGTSSVTNPPASSAGPPASAPDGGTGPVTVTPPPPPPPAKHHLTVDVAGMGEVSTSDGSVACPGVCEADFDDGAAIRFSARPATGYDPPTFSGACSGQSCSFVIRQDARIVALFARTQVTVRVQIAGSGTVVSTPAGINCPGRCSASFDYGAAVALSPSAAPGWAISTQAAQCGAGRCDGLLTGDETYSVTFGRQRMLTIVTSGDGSGRVVSTPAGIDCPGHCSAAFFDGTAVTLVASPDVSSMIASWGGDCSSAPCSVVLRADATAKLVWRPRRYIARDVGPQYTSEPSDARAISLDGRYVAGLAGPGNSIFFWHGGAMITRLDGNVTGINASGTMCGTTSDFHGYTLSSQGVFTDLGADTVAVGVNDAGVAVGYKGMHAAYWPPAGNPVDLGAIDGRASYANAINSRGVIVGASSVALPLIGGVVIPTHAARWRAPDVIDDLGTLGGNESDAAGISENGLIVGSSSLPGDQHWHGFFIGGDGRMVDIGVPRGMTDSRLTGVSSQGTAIGEAFDGTSMSGIVYREGRLYRLGELVVPGDLSVWIPTGIAEDGSIAAYGNAADGQGRALLLTLEPQ